MDTTARAHFSASVRVSIALSQRPSRSSHPEILLLILLVSPISEQAIDIRTDRYSCPSGPFDRLGQIPVRQLRIPHVNPARRATVRRPRRPMRSSSGHGGPPWQKGRHRGGGRPRRRPTCCAPRRRREACATLGRSQMLPSSKHIVPPPGGPDQGHRHSARCSPACDSSGAAAPGCRTGARTAKDT